MPIFHRYRTRGLPQAEKRMGLIKKGLKKAESVVKRALEAVKRANAAAKRGRQRG